MQFTVFNILFRLHLKFVFAHKNEHDNDSVLQKYASGRGIWGDSTQTVVLV